eukprot:5258484-Amphidinium_carterae.1
MAVQQEMNLSTTSDAYFLGDCGSAGDESVNQMKLNSPKFMPTGHAHLLRCLHEWSPEIEVPEEMYLFEMT